MKSGFFLAVLAVLGLAASCATGKQPSRTVEGSRVEKTAPFTVIDNKGSAYGAELPDWMLASLESRSKLAELYPGQYVFPVMETGADLDGVKMWAENFSVNVEFSRLLGTAVKSAAANAQSGDKDRLNAYAQTVAQVISDTEFSGLRKEADWWILKRYNEDGRQEYEFTVLYLIDKQTLDERLGALIDKEVGAEAKEEVGALMDAARSELFGA